MRLDIHFIPIQGFGTTLEVPRNHLKHWYKQKVKTFYLLAKLKKLSSQKISESLLRRFSLVGLPGLVPSPISLPRIEHMSFGMVDVLISCSWIVLLVRYPIPFGFQHQKLRKMLSSIKQLFFLSKWYHIVNRLKEATGKEKEILFLKSQLLQVSASQHK